MGGKPDALQQLKAFFPRRRFVTLQYLYLCQRQVFDNRQMGKQLKVLKYHPNVGAKLGEVGFLIGHLGAVYQDFTLLHRLQAVNGFNQR